MLKCKKLIAGAVVSLLICAIVSVTAFAYISYTCSLAPANKGSVATKSLTAEKMHYSGYNSVDSTNYLEVKAQAKVNGSWAKVAGPVNLKPGAHHASNTAACPPGSYRTTIRSVGGKGGAEGTGCIFDY